MIERPGPDDRAVSIVVNYVIVLTIVALLGSGLFVTATDYVQSQQSSAIRSELRDVGNDLAADLSAADRLARSSTGDGTVSLHTAPPDRVAGSTYRISIRSTGADRYEIVLRSTDPAVTVTVPFRSRTPVAEGPIQGDSLVVRTEKHDGTIQTVVITDD